MKKSKNPDRNGEPKGSAGNAMKTEFEDEVDALFRLPLADFTGARNTLAARLKKIGRGEEAALVKALAKPSVSAWTVNQLYWNRREPFERLIASGERFHKAQASRLTGKVAEIGKALDARREALTDLTGLATSVLRDAGQNPSLDTIRRITSTLEALSAMSATSVSASRSDAPRPGRLTHDIDPPGFESFASFAASEVPSMRSVPTAEAGGSRSVRRNPTSPSTTARDTDLIATKTRGKVSADDGKRHVEETRKAKLAAGKISLQDAKRSLTEARARAQSLDVAQKKADAEAKKAEKHTADLEEKLEIAKAASKNAARRARDITFEAAAAARVAEDAESKVAKVSKELDALSRES